MQSLRGGRSAIQNLLSRIKQKAHRMVCFGFVVERVEPKTINIFVDKYYSNRFFKISFATE